MVTNRLKTKVLQVERIEFIGPNDSDDGLIIYSDNGITVEGADYSLRVITDSMSATNMSISASPTTTYSTEGHILPSSGLDLFSVTKTNNYNLLSTDNVILVNATAKGITIKLPDATNSRNLYVVKKIDNSANQVAIVTQTGDTIEGNTSEQLTLQYQSLAVFSDGAGHTWYKLSNTSVTSGTTTSTSTTTTSTSSTSTSTTTTSTSSSTTTTSTSTSTTTTSTSTSTSTTTTA